MWRRSRAAISPSSRDVSDLALVPTTGGAVLVGENGETLRAQRFLDGHWSTPQSVPLPGTSIIDWLAASQPDGAVVLARVALERDRRASSSRGCAASDPQAVLTCIDAATVPARRD